MGQSGVIRVVVADDDAAVIEYVRATLACEDGEFEIVATAEDAGGAIDAVTNVQPDVLLLDLGMPGGGLTAAQLVGSLAPDTKVVVFTADAQGEELLALLRAGISGYVLKSSDADQVVAALRTAVAGGASYAPHIADQAMRELAKRLHGEHAVAALASRRRERVERVIRDRAFEIVFQPIADLVTGERYAVEALTRFGTQDARPPTEWFAEAVAVSRGIDLEFATATAALEQLERLDPRLDLTINLSPTAVLSGRLNLLLEATVPERVVIELTEHVAVEDYEFLNITLRRWRDRGVRIAIDDAGAGYSSFAHVLRLKPDFIKLDLDITRGIDTDPARQALARALVSFAVELGIQVIAEGIETDAEFATMAALGAHLGQGYRLGRPLPLAQQPHLMREDEQHHLLERDPPHVH